MKIILAVAVIVLMIGAKNAYASVFSNNIPYNASDFPIEKHQSTTALRQPYWSATPVISPDYKSVHIVLTHIDHGIGKTKVNLNLLPGGNYSLDSIELAKHVVDVSKHVRPGELNATLDAGYFIIPASLIDSSGEWLQVGVKVLKEDSTVNWPLKPTVYLDLEEYYLII